MKRLVYVLFFLLQFGMVSTAIGGGENFLINGDMRVNQRGLPSLPSTNYSDNTFTLDRWKLLGATSKVYANTGGNLTNLDFQNSQVALNGYLGLQVTSTNKAGIVQYIENKDVAILNGAGVTLSFWAKAVAPTTGMKLRASVLCWIGTADSPAHPISSWNESESLPTLDTITNNWKWPADSYGNQHNPTAFSLENNFQLFAVSVRVKPSDSNNKCTNLAAIIWLDTPSGSTPEFQITGIKLERGFSVTPFESRPYAQELLLAKRYFQTVSYLSMFSDLGTPSYAKFAYQFPVEMRTTPTVTVNTSATSIIFNEHTGNFGQSNCSFASSGTSSIGASSVGVIGGWITSISVCTLTGTKGYNVASNTPGQALINFDAEP